MKATKQPPSPEQTYRMTAYAKIDKILTRKELQKDEYRCKDIRNAVLSIGARVK